MGDNTKIEWTDASWTPIRALDLKTGKIGWHCEHATTGCEFCYAESMNKRLGTGLPFKPGHRAHVKIFLDEKMLTLPLHWKRRRMVFVCSMTDLFADFVSDEMIDRVFALMALCPQHTFQVLTKRAERMRAYFQKPDEFGRPEVPTRVYKAAFDLSASIKGPWPITAWPLPNVWLGVSCERQEEADERIPLLLQTPAAVRFISAEPLLGAIDLTRIARQPSDEDRAMLGFDRCTKFYWDAVGGNEGVEFNGAGQDQYHAERDGPKLDWVIVGGESGPNARPMYPGWARDLRDQCAAAKVAFFFKQWGEHTAEIVPGTNVDLKYDLKPNQSVAWGDGKTNHTRYTRVGKKAAGRVLDGREHNDFPVIDSSVTQRGLSSPESKTAEVTPA